MSFKLINNLKIENSFSLTFIFHRIFCKILLLGFRFRLCMDFPNTEISLTLLSSIAVRAAKSSLYNSIIFLVLANEFLNQRTSEPVQCFDCFL